MAAIDKTYCSSWEEYQELVNWAKGKVLYFPKGQKINVIDFVWEREKEEFGNGYSVPIMNTPTWFDKYLYKNCPVKFVIDRLNNVYKEGYLLEKSLTFSKEEIGRKFTITKTNQTRFPIHNKCYRGWNWWIQCEDRNWWYNSEYDYWAHNSQDLPTDTDTFHIHSLKALTKKIVKRWNLPKGLKFIISGRYVGEEYLLTIK